MVNRYVKRFFDIDCYHTAFRFEYAEDFEFKGERHDFYEMTLIMSGAVIVTSDEMVYKLRRGEAIIHPPMSFHRIMSADGTTPKGYTATFHTSGRIPGLDKAAPITLSDENLADFSNLFDELIPYVKEGEKRNCEGQLLTARLTELLIRVTGETSGEPLPFSASAVEYNKVVTKMSASVNDNLELPEIAKDCNISLSYLKKLFSKYAGVSPKLFYHSLRAEAAAGMLKSGYAVGEVAEIMHFSSPEYFCEFFKRFYKISPSRYKASIE
ncbi:MAG: AraC family transcriptional regulator [Clostridia bacterium]|nr:AraC family transcriptional regulator [Clostridia bacterium]